MKPGTASNGIRIEQSPNTKEVVAMPFLSAAAEGLGEGHPDGGGGKDD
jgi:hypothetical protein